MIMLFNTNDDASVQKLANALSDLNDKHKDKIVTYRIEIKKNLPIRSVDHNRYYRVVLKAIASYTGYTEDELHEYYKKKFNSKYVFEELVGQTTSDLDSGEFNIYVKKIKDEAEKLFGLKFPEKADKTYAVWEMITKNNYDQMFESI